MGLWCQKEKEKMTNLNIGKAIILLIILVGVITTFFLSKYVSVILMGSVFNTKNPSFQSVNVIGDPFQGNDTVPQQLSNTNITPGTMRIYNTTTTFGLDNFTIDFPQGTVLVNWFVLDVDIKIMMKYYVKDVGI